MGSIRRRGGLRCGAAAAVLVSCAVMGASPAHAANAARGFELVSPADAGGVDAAPLYAQGIAAIAEAQYPNRVASVDGDRVLFGSALRPFPGFAASLSQSPYLGERTATGWTVTYAGVPSRSDSQGRLAIGQYISGAADLSRISTYSRLRLNADDPGGDPDNLRDVGADIFTQERSAFGTGLFEWATRNPLPTQPAGPPDPNEPTKYRIEPITASSDDRTVLFGSPVALTTAAEQSADPQIYVNRNTAQNSELVSQYPNGAPMGAPRFLTARLSANGQVAAFIATPESGVGRHLYVRLLEQGTTIDVGPSGGPFGDDTELSVSADGNYVVFSTATAAASSPTDSDASRDVYRFDVAARTVERLSAAGAGAPDTGQADVCDNAIPTASSGEPSPDCPSTHVITSADGSATYLLSPERLTAGGGAVGPQRGQGNLYEARGESLRFVATLSTSDLAAEDRIGGGNPQGIPEVSGARRPVRTSEDGRTLVFQSDRNLAGADARGRRQVYVWTEANGRISCASCGSPALGGAGLSALEAGSEAGRQPPQNDATGSAGRNVSSDGKYVYFDSTTRLVPADLNGANDVYEYAIDTGTVGLVSSGGGEDGSFYIDSSSDGRDVFFQTTMPLVPADRNGGANRIYDARRGGGFPSPEAGSAPCMGASCRGPAGSAPAAPGLNTVTPGPNENASSSRRATVAIAGPSAKARRAAAVGGRIPVAVRYSRSGQVQVELRVRVGRRVQTITTKSVRVRAKRRSSVSLVLSREVKKRLAEGQSLRFTATVRGAGARSRSVQFTLKGKAQR